MKSQTRTGLVWDTNMAIILLFWDNNMLEVSSWEKGSIGTSYKNT